jgi:hypothetical protein
MTIEIGLPSTASTRATVLSDAIAAGQAKAKQIAADFAAQQRKGAQATLALAQKQVLNTFHSAMKLRALGGDMHFMVDMVDSALRLAQPAIKTLRSDPSNTAVTKQVADLANVAEEVGIVARMSASNPDALKRVNQSWSYLSTTLKQTRSLNQPSIFA